MVAICYSVRERGQYSSRIKEVELCTQVETFVRVMETGIITSPQPTQEETAAVDLANSRIRSLLQTAIQATDCG